MSHAFRSSFRDWAAEYTEALREISELALARVYNAGSDPSYRRIDLFERRRTLVQQWADYLGASV